MRISVCTTTARRGFVEHQALALARQELAGHELEWVLIDFAFEDRQQAMAVEARRLRLGLKIIHAPNVRDDQLFFRDITRNRNKALALATGDHVIFLDDYAVVPPDWVMQHLLILSQGYISAGNMFRLEHQIDNLSFVDTTAPIDILERYAQHIGMDHRVMRNKRPITHPYLGYGISYTGNLGIPRSVFERLNGFDPRMESGLEDCDFGRRAYGAGIGCYFNPSAYCVNFATGHIPYTQQFSHVHDIEPFIKNELNKFSGDNQLKENEFMTVEFCGSHRIAHCKKCGAHGMIDPYEYMNYKQRNKEWAVPLELPGGLDTLRKELA